MKILKTAFYIQSLRMFNEIEHKHKDNEFIGNFIPYIVTEIKRRHTNGQEAEQIVDMIAQNISDKIGISQSNKKVWAYLWMSIFDIANDVLGEKMGNDWSTIEIEEE